MGSRVTALFLALVLAAPLCCCGWRGLVQGEAAEVAAVSCPMCAGLAEEVGGEGETCPCEKEWILRDLVPKGALLGQVVSEGQGMVWEDRGFSAVRELAQDQRLAIFQGRRVADGPPRLYLRYGAWLC